MEGPDHQASVEPDELSKLVQSVKNVSKALGDGYKQPQPPESSVQDLARKSLIASTSIDKNTTLQKKHISVKRPGNGIAPKHLEKITGLELKKAKEKDQAFRWTDFKGNT
jgi:sialic acid synthase SpsE